MYLLIKRTIILALLCYGMAPYAALKAQVFTYNFSTGYEGWEGDFADYPASDSVFYELAFTRTGLPAPLDTARKALMVTGNNHSDDLFMFLRRKFTGLQPNQDYMVYIGLQLASQAPTNAIGVGGAPGEGVTLKAGVTLIRPRKVADGAGYYLMNTDKGNQSSPGTEMDTIGHVGVTDTTTVFALIQRSNYGHVFPFTTDSLGEGWVCIGTESGYEATTTLYYSEITVSFTIITGIEDPERETLRAWPNPVQYLLQIEGVEQPARYEMYNLQGQMVQAGSLDLGVTAVEIGHLSPGLYILLADGHSTRIVKE